MLKDLKGRMNDFSENLNKEIVSIKKNTETTNKNQSEMKNTLEVNNIRIDKTEDKIRKLEDKIQ